MDKLLHNTLTTIY